MVERLFPDPKLRHLEPHEMPWCSRPQFVRLGRVIKTDQPLWVYFLKPGLKCPFKDSSKRNDDPRVIWLCPNNRTTGCAPGNSRRYELSVVLCESDLL